MIRNILTPQLVLFIVIEDQKVEAISHIARTLINTLDALLLSRVVSEHRYPITPLFSDLMIFFYVPLPLDTLYQTCL